MSRIYKKFYTAIDENNYSEIRRMLQEERIDVNYPDEEGWSPIILASAVGNSRVVELLLQHGADIDDANNDGNTPLIVAAAAGDTNVVDFLIQHGADVNQANNVGQTPLYVSTERSRFPVIELLLQHGADVNKAMDDGTTPLHFATEQGYNTAAHMLRNFRDYILPVNANAVISNNSIPLAVNDDNDADVSVADAISIPHAELSYDTDNLPVVNATKMRWGGRKTNKKRKMNKKLKTNKKRKMNKKRKTNKKR